MLESAITALTHLASETDDAVLRRDVGCSAARANHSRHGRDIDDARRSLTCKRVKREFGDEVRAGEMDIQDSPPDLRFRLVDWTVPIQDSSGVDENAQRAVHSHSLADGIASVVLITDICLDCQRRAPGLCNFSGSLLGRRDVKIYHREWRAARS